MRWCTKIIVNIIFVILTDDFKVTNQLKRDKIVKKQRISLECRKKNHKRHLNILIAYLSTLDISKHSTTWSNQTMNTGTFRSGPIFGKQVYQNLNFFLKT